MVDTNEMESFLNEKSAKENDIVEILNEGVIEIKEDATTKRKYRVLNLPVRVNGKLELIFTPNKDAVEVLKKAYGTNTQKWIGKKFTVKFYPKLAFGQTKTAILPVIIEQKA
jgi:hypothetical protein